MRVYFTSPSYNYRDLLKKDIKEVAKEFEALMIKQILKEAYRPILKKRSFYQRLYYDMFLEGVSEKLAEGGGIGIAKFIVESYQKNSSSKEGLKEHVRSILRREGLPEWLALIPEVESGYDPKAVSPKGAVGLWQLMPDTARAMGLRVDERVDERLDPIKSTEAAVRYLKYLKNRFKSWLAVLVAYNWGEGNLLKYEGEEVLKDLRKLPPETKNYVKRFLDLVGSDNLISS